MPTIRQVYLYEDKNLPKCGWFQGCILCSMVTSKTVFYDFKSDETFGVERALNDFFSEDTSIYLESQGVDNSRVDKNDKPLVAYSYSITKKSQ